MTDNVAISIANIAKSYKLYNSPLDRLKESLHPLRKLYHHDFFALNDVSFEIKKGESVGIIGKNGSGKSTLLKILTGVLTPSSGRITVNGKVSALLELGAGFNPELSGVENIYFNGMLMGYSREEMDEQLEEILAFADIGQFVHQPVKIYSSGMFVRLAFAVGINVKPDILIVDEALSVGDVQFQQKCMIKIQEFKEGGGTLLFVSHDMNAVRLLCSSVIFLESGRIGAQGDPINVIDMYLGKTYQEHYNNQTELILHKRPVSHGSSFELNTGEITLLSARLYNDEGDETNYVISETDMTIEFTLQANKAFDDPHYGFQIRNIYGNSAFETNSYCMGVRTSSLHNGQFVTVSISMNCNLPAADYTISFGFGNKGYGRGLFYEGVCLIHNLLTFTVMENEKSIIYTGYTNLKPHMEFR